MNKMIDPYTVWMVPENEEEEKKFETLVNMLTDKFLISVNYDTIKKLLKMDYIILGKDDSDEEGISGAIEFEKHILKDNKFQSVVVVNNKYFKPLFKYLTKDMKPNRHTIIEFHFQREKPVIVVVDTIKAGAIAPYMGDF